MGALVPFRPSPAPLAPADQPKAIVTVATGGGRWTAFKRVQVEAAVNEACRSFELVIAAEAGGSGTNAIFRNFAPISISADGDLLVAGYIDNRKPKLSGKEAEMTIGGRSKGQDAVDCSHMHETGRFEKKTALQIAQAIDIYDVGFSSDAQLDPIDEYQLTPGETVFREVERLCRDEALSLSGQADGSVKLWNADGNLKRHAGAIVEGVNLFEAEAEHNTANRHSDKHVRGHQAKGTGKAAHQISATAKDSGVPRTRHHLRIHDGNTDKKRAAKRANNHRDRSAGNGLRATVTMVGWRDGPDGFTGTLWTPGWRVFVQSPFLDIAQDMLIEKVCFTQADGDGSGEEGGTKAKLSLVDPRAYAGKGGGRNKSGAEWAVDGEDAS